MAAVLWAAVTLFLALWATAPVRQRDEAREELRKARAKAKFPRGRIQVAKLGALPENGKRVLRFTLEVTNREDRRRMNLKVDFYLRHFKSIAQSLPGLRPLDTRLFEVEREDSPRRPLIVEAQHSTRRLNYYALWPEGAGGLVFDDEDPGSFRPEHDDDVLLARVVDLQSGGELELEIPSVWEL